MQIIDNNIDMTCSRAASETLTSPALNQRLATSQRLSAILGVGVVALAGPAMVETLTRAALSCLQIVLEMGQLGLVAYQIFGR
jgi:predicted thioesterase